MARIAANTITCGNGWCVQDVVCSHGLHDRPFDEQAVTSGAARSIPAFRALRRPPIRTLSPVIADACAALSGEVVRAIEREPGRPAALMELARDRAFRTELGMSPGVYRRARLG